MKSLADLNNRSTIASTPNRSPVQGFHYLWAVGATAARKGARSRISSRYQVVSAQIWLDTQPDQDPESPQSLSDEVLPYLHLFPYRLHIPEVYGVCRDGETGEEILLLENVPLTETGQLQPSIVSAWDQATSVRQAYWLWQILELWTPLSKLGVASSVLAPDNIRVEGWRIRLKELIHDLGEEPTLADLAKSWLVWLPEARSTIAESLQELCTQMQAEDAEYSAISAQLNQLLIEQSSRLPLRVQIYSATDIGRARSHNEDSCYPLALNAPAFDDLSPRLMIVCDGIGGHEGGEVASQLAIQAIQLQVRALLAEVAGQPQTVQPELMCEQIAAIVRVVNNLIASQNDAQSREARRRMGTTLVMALQIPQAVTLPGGSVSINANELYIANVGDSRAYWITPDYCHQLTVDDDVAVREVRMGRSLYREALKQPNSGALTQALGTRDGSYLYPTVRRFILEEDGILLLCSDGLSDNGFIEQSWADYAELILRDRFSLETAVQSWLEFANQRNGHDNISIVLAHCQVSSSLPAMQVPIAPPTPLEVDEAELPEPIIIPPTAAPEKPSRKKAGWLKPVLFLLLLAGAVGGAGAWYYFDRAGVQRFTNEVKTQVDTLQKRIQSDLLKR